MASLSELQAAARAANLNPYGSKAAIEARLNAHAAKQLESQEADLVASESPASELTTQSPLPADADAAATTPIMQKSARVTFAADGRNTNSGLVLPTPAEARILTGAISEPSSGKISLTQAQDHLVEMKNRYPGLNVRLDPQQEVFIFEGGLQGRMTTTIHQPLKALIHNISGVAPGYITAHQAAAMARGETGDLLGKAAVYE